LFSETCGMGRRRFVHDRNLGAGSTPVWTRRHP
jgi:hypothetical protein